MYNMENGMKVKDLYAKDKSLVKFGLCIKGLKTGGQGVLYPPFDDEFDSTAHFFHEDKRPNGYGHFYFDECENEVILGVDNQPQYQDLPVVTFS